MTEQFPNLVKDTTLQIQKAQQTASRRGLKKTNGHILKNEEKGKTLKQQTKQNKTKNFTKTYYLGNNNNLSDL